MHRMMTAVLASMLIALAVCDQAHADAAGPHRDRVSWSEQVASDAPRFERTVRVPMTATGRPASARVWYQGADESIKEAEALETGDLAKTSQNPVGNLISLPFQNNMDFGFGPFDRVKNTMNIQPVIPIDISCKWRLITRTILPVISQPDSTAISGRTGGIGDLNPTVWLTPANPGKIMWGAGTVTFFPTATDVALGTGKFSIGPSVVIVATPGKFVMGGLASNFWSVAGESSRPDVNGFFSQVFINYNLPNQWYLTSAPIITANWKAPSGERWVVPLGGGFGKILKVGKRPINTTLQAYYNVVRPTNAADWQLRFQVQLLFPKGG